MLGERHALGAMLGAGGWGRCIGPRPRAAAHVAIKMLGHPYAQEPALVARFTQEARAAAGLSHPNIVAVFDSGSEAGMHDLAMRAWRRNPRRPHQHRGVARVPPGGKAGELVDELVKDPDKQVRRAIDGFRQVVERGGLVGG
jgi:hypothetical protein